MKSNTNHSIVYMDGHYLKVRSKLLEVFTPGRFQGDGVFETMLSVGDKVFDLREHLKRLQNSFKGAKVSVKNVQNVVESNHLSLGRVRVLAWRDQKKVHTAIMVLPYRLTKKVFTVCFVQTNRPASSRFAQKKSLDYGVFFESYNQAHAQGFDEALLINRQGYVFEGSRSNIFIADGGRLLTPPLSSGCLNGITRQKFIKMARQMGVTVLEKNLTPKQIHSAQEVFLTNSLIGIKPCLVCNHTIKISFTSLPH